LTGLANLRVISTSKVYQEIWTETRHENYGISVPFGGVKTEKATQVNGFGGLGSFLLK
jgi:hypothetical protein